MIHEESSNSKQFWQIEECLFFQIANQVEKWVVSNRNLFHVKKRKKGGQINDFIAKNGIFVPEGDNISEPV